MSLLELLRPRGLAVRLAGVISLALLPVGIMSILQSQQITEEYTRRQENALLALTAEAAAGEAQAIAAARGLVGGLAALLAQAIRDPFVAPNGCDALFQRVMVENDQLSFAGFVDRSGIVRCASDGVGRDVSGGVTYQAMISNTKPQVLVNLEAPISGTSVVVTTAPVQRDGDFLGYVAVSIPHSAIDAEAQIEEALEPLDLVTFNSEGQVLSSSGGFDNLDERLPQDRSLAALAGPAQVAFTDRNNHGDERTFAIVPIVPDAVYAMGSWPAEGITWFSISPFVFPLLMVAAGLISAHLAVDRLVVRHVRELRQHMDEFSTTRQIVSLRGRGSLARELEEIDQSWQELAERLIMDEAELEGMVHEKNVLIKEVHHRVKNNLQLIASIVNMKIRKAATAEARNALKEVQGRVMSIAAVHQALYSSTDSGAVWANDLLQSVINGTLASGLPNDRVVDVQADYAPVALYPDQAVPLLLLASEAVTNALKYMGKPENEAARLTISLTQEAEGMARLTVVNSCGVPFLPPEQVKGSGLGRSLMQGFAIQIGGKVTIDEAESFFSFSVDFKPAPFDETTRDLTDFASESDT